MKEVTARGKPLGKLVPAIRRETRLPRNPSSPAGTYRAELLDQVHHKADIVGLVGVDCTASVVV